MDLRQLRYYVAVAEERHFGRAAVRLHMAQPPVSQAIRSLERDLGVVLLRRTTRQVDLTAAGSAYLARARQVLAAVDAAQAEAQRIDAGLVGRLAIGCVGSATYSLLPVLARRVRERLPGVDLSVRGEMLGPDLLAALDSGDLDLALLRPPAAPDPAVRLVPLRRDRLVVALPDDHRLAARRRLRVADLRGQDLVAHPGRGRSVMNGVVADLCRAAGFEPRVVHEVGETSTLVTYVAAGLGLAVVPEPVTVLALPGVTFKPLAAAAATVDLAAATRSADAAPATALQALDELASLVEPA